MSETRIFCIGALLGQTVFFVATQIAGISSAAYLLCLPIIWISSGITAVAFFGGGKS